MKLEFGDGWVKHSGGVLIASHPVLEAREIAGLVVVLYDYMAFPRGEPSRNLFAYNLDGTLHWRAEDIGQGRVDGYTNIMSEQPLVVGNFSSFTCTIDLRSGRVLSKVFTK
jgi:hypothetical protein